MFKKTGAKEGAKKCLYEFRIPMEMATKPTKKMYGNMIRFRRMVKFSFSGLDINPKAMSRTMRGEKIIPRMETAASTTKKKEKVTLAKLFVSSLVLRVIYSVKTGTMDMTREPSAKNLRNILGIRNATMKASVIIPAPKNLATTISLKNPMILLRNVANPTTEAAFVICFSSETIVLFWILDFRFWIYYIPHSALYIPQFLTISLLSKHK
jgi:hypothetical protein